MATHQIVGVSLKQRRKGVNNLDEFKLNIHIYLDTDAMQNENDLMEAVENFMKSVRHNRGFPMEGRIIDRNGKKVGTTQVTEVYNN